MRSLVMSSVLVGFSLIAVGCGETVASSTLTSAGAERAPESWDGTYKGTWSGPPAIPGQDRPAVEYVVQVSTTPAGTAVEISADGSHTTIRMRGEGRASGGGELGVFFVACQTDDMFKCAGLHKGDRLFSLRSSALLFGAMSAPDLKTTQMPMSLSDKPVTPTLAKR